MENAVISLFTGAGGLDLGLEAAGFRTALAVEYNSAACRTLRANRSPARPWRVLEASIHDVSSADLVAEAGVGVGDAALLIGGPPCQPFSKSAYWATGDTKRLDDPRADTLTAYLRVLRDLQPKGFILENVFGLTYKGKDEALRLLRDTVEKINREVGTHYSFEWSVLNTADYGVPQIRERFFLIGLRNGVSFKFPDPTHSPDADRTPQTGLFQPLRPWTTAWDAIGDLQDIPHPELGVTGKWAGLLPSIPEGQNYLYHTDRKDGLPLFKWRSRYWSFLLKLAKARPSWTIQAQPGAGIGPFHWKNRRLSVQEMMRIQTFPDGYSIEGGITGAQRQLGNAVPSLMAETLGRELRSYLGLPRLAGPRALLRTASTSAPDPEPTQSVPERYLSLLPRNTGDLRALAGK